MQGDGEEWGGAGGAALIHQVCAPDAGPAHPIFFQGMGQNLWGLHRRPWRRASSPIAGGIRSVSPSYGNDLGLWVAGILGQGQAKISINTSTEPFMGFTRNFIGVW